MADLNTATRTKVAQIAGQKTTAGSFNPVRKLFIDTPAVWSGANGDTAGTGIVLPMGARISAEVIISSAVGTASTTLSVGLRNNATKVASDATAYVTNASIATAQTQSVVTGTKTTGGQFYTVPEESEVFLTFGGATPLANQAIRIELEFVSP